MNGESPFSAPSLRELARPKGVTEGVSSVEWQNPKSSEFRRGDENRPKPRILASTRVNGTSPFPAPSLRELLSAAKLRECTSVNVRGQKFQSLYELMCKSLAWRNHRTTLPQSALAGCQLPQRGSRERVRRRVPFNRVLAKPEGYGRFSSPLRNSEWVTFHHSIYRSETVGVAGDFHRPKGVFHSSKGGTHPNYSWVVSISLTVLAISKKGA